MARTDNLTNYLTDVASAIKEKKGDTTPINASNFDTEIRNLPSGGGADLSDYFDMSMIENYKGSGNNTIGVVPWTAAIKKIPPITIKSTTTSLNYIFYNMIYCEEIEIKEANTNKVTKTSSAFYGCNNLKRIKGFEKMNLSAVTSASSMFSNCNRLEEIDLSKMNLSGLNSFSSMFLNVGNLIASGALPKIYVKDAAAQNWVLTANNGHPSNWSTANVIIAGSADDTR